MKKKPSTKRKTAAKAPKRTSTRRTRRPAAAILSTGADFRMTADQKTRLRQLAEDGYEIDAFSSQLTQKEAATRIAMLEAKLRLQDGPPHTR